MSKIFQTLLVAAALAFAGTAQAEDFPVTVTHAYGETTIEKAPARVVTWGWANEDAMIAIGVIPVGTPFQSYGGGDNGLQPWVEDALKAAGAEAPKVFDQANEPPYEQIAALKPDLIFAGYSGITQDQYSLLSGIAPTVAYVGDAWSTPWQDLTLLAGKVTGRTAEAEKVVADTTAWIKDKIAAHPELAGLTFIGVNDYDGALAIYDALDARMKFLTDLGLVLAPSVAENSPKDGSFYYSLSHELADKMVSDILITYWEDQAASDAFLTAPYMAALPQVKKGAVAALIGTENVAAVSPPSALSLKWGFERYLDLIVQAARKAKS